MEGINHNSDGLYKLSELDARFNQAMSEYDAIVDEPTSLQSANSSTTSKSADIYNLQGQRLEALQPGISRVGGEKVMGK